MADYKAMYYEIFNKVSDVIGERQAIQLQTETMYANYEEPEIHLLENDLLKEPSQENK